jgi:hypothetical protein
VVGIGENKREIIEKSSFSFLKADSVLSKIRSRFDVIPFDSKVRHDNIRTLYISLKREIRCASTVAGAISRNLRRPREQAASNPQARHYSSANRVENLCQSGALKIGEEHRRFSLGGVQSPSMKVASAPKT